MVQLLSFICLVCHNKLIEILVLFRTEIFQPAWKDLTLVQWLGVLGQLTRLNGLEPMEVREASKFPCDYIGRGPHSWHSYFSGYKLTRALPSGPQDL